MMDSTAGEDPTLPINFDESTNISRLPDITTGPDITMSNFGVHFPETNGGSPGFQKIGSGRLSPVRTHTMKDYEQQIGEMKKENFSLKLRIYFMEERLQQNFNDDAKTNIELRVEVESLKNDLREKQQLLIKASNAVESLAHEKDSIVEKMTKEKKKEAQVNGNRLQEDFRQAIEEAEALKSSNEQLQKKLEDAQFLQQQLSGNLQDKSLQTQAALENSKEALAEKDRIINQLNNALKNKDDVIDQLNKEKTNAQAELKPKEDKLRELEEKLKDAEEELKELKDDIEREKSDKDSAKSHYQEMYLEQEKRLVDLEAATESMQDKLKDKDKAIKEMQNKLKKAQQEVKDGGSKLRENERELQKQESNANKRDRAIQGLTEAIKNKDEEIKHLCDQIEDQEEALAKARDKLREAEKAKLDGLDNQRHTIADLQTEVAEMRGNLRAKDLENERLQKALSRRQDEIAHLREEQGSGDSQMENLLANKDKTIQDLKDQLQAAKDQMSGRLGSTEQHYQDLLEDAQQQLQNKERTNQRLTDALQKKDQVIKEYVDFAKSAKTSPADGKESKDKTVEKLKTILQQRDKELEDALEEKFIAVQAKEDEIRQIRQALRERDKEIERQNSDLLHHNDRINELESELKEKEAKNRQLANALKAKTDAMNNADEGHQRVVAEKDSIVRKLQHALADKDRLSEEMRNLGNGSPREEETNAIIKQLSQRLKNKDKMMEEMVSERAEAAESNDKATQDLLSSLQDKDRQIKALHDRHNKLIADKNEIIKALQREIANKDMDIQSVEDTLARSQQDQSILLGKMRAAMAEKDKTIEKLVESGQEKDRLFQDLQRATPPSAGPDFNAMKNEISRLRREIKARDAALNEMRANSVSKEHLQALEKDLDSKNDLLEKARETINALQQNQKDDRQTKLELAKLRRKIIELQSELDVKQDHIDALVHAGKVKDNMIKELRLQVPKQTALSHDSIDGPQQNDHLYQALAAQVREMENLNKALKAERQLYVNITHNGDSKNTTHNDAFQIELAAVQSLRKQLEQALKRNNRMRENLERQVSSQTLSDLDSENTSNDNELQALRDRLEESQRWNADLQSRVKDLQQRGGGVGSDADSEVIRITTTQPQASPRPPPVEEIIGVQNIDVMSPKELKDEIMRLQLQLLEANRSSLDDDVRSIPGQEETSQAVKQSKKEIEKLKAKNKELENEVKVLEQQLASSPGRGDGLDETDSHVVPVLKQQLDQAKSLLQDKDTLLQEKEQQNQALRHHLGIGPESPIQPGRNVMTTLQRENAQLAAQLHKAQHQKKDLQDELQGLESQLREAEKMSSKMQKQLKSATANVDAANLVPILKHQLDQAKEVIQEREHQNKALQQALKKRSPDKNQLEQLQAENEELKVQLVGYNKELQNMRSQFQALEKELEEVQNLQPPPSAQIEIERLQKQLRNAENLNELLKKHIELNSSTEGDQPSFNPELIVDMAKEIERLKDTLDETQKELSTDSPLKTRVGTRVKALDDTAYGALTKQLEQAHNDLHDLKKRYKQLNSKLQATEGTVRQQSDRIRRYRHEMKDAGLEVPRTPKRYHSDSNLLRAHFDNLTRKMSGASLLSPDDRSGSASPSSSERSLMVDIPLSEFGQTNDVNELKSQVDTLKLHLQRSRRALRSLQNRLRNRSNTSSPARVASPSRTDSSSLDGGGTWFELVANQQAFEKLQQEVENLREQVEEANNVNMTLQEHNNDLIEKVNSNIPVPPGLLAHNEQLIKENETEIAMLKQQLEDSQHLCDTLRELIDEALSAMEEISLRKEDEKDSSPSEVERARQKVKKSKLIAEDLGKVLEEHLSRTSNQVSGDILENRQKDREIQQLKKEVKQRKELNKKLRDLLGENKKTADETRQELERLTKEVHEKNETITKLRRQVRHLQAMGSFSSTNSQPISETEDTSSMQFQTTANTESMLPGDEGDATDTELDLPLDSNSLQQFVGRSHKHMVGSIPGKDHVSSDGGESQDTVKDQFEQFSDPLESQRQHLPHPPTVSRLKRGKTIGKTKDDDSSEAAVQTRVTWASKDSASKFTQTSQQTAPQPELSRLQAKLLQSEKQIESLKSELDLYKHLLADSPQVSGRSDGDIIKQHLEEIRALRKRLEESITVNDRLREQLEAKLAELNNGAGDTDIFIYQRNLELTEENKLLKERLHEKDSAFHELVEELKKNKRHLQKLKSQNHHLSEQLQENIDLVASLKFELNILEQVQQKDGKSSSTSPGYIHIKDPSGLDLSELLHEIRRLRVQLERSIETNNALRQKLEEVMREKWSPSGKTSVTSLTINSSDKKQREEVHRDELSRSSRQKVSRQLFNAGGSETAGSPSRSGGSMFKEPQYRSTDDLSENRSRSGQRDAGVGSSQARVFDMQAFDSDVDVDPTLCGSDGPATNQDGNLDKMYAVGTLPTYESLKTFLNESRIALNALELHMKEKMTKEALGSKPILSGWSHGAQSLRRHLEESVHYLSLFWTASLPPKDELGRLRKKLAYQDKVMKSTLKTLESTNRMKEGMEAAIYNQLTKTHDVLKQARGNLQAESNCMR